MGGGLDRRLGGGAAGSQQAHVVEAEAGDHILRRHDDRPPLAKLDAHRHPAADGGVGRRGPVNVGHHAPAADGRINLAHHAGGGRRAAILIQNTDLAAQVQGGGFPLGNLEAQHGRAGGDGDDCLTCRHHRAGRNPRRDHPSVAGRQDRALGRELRAGRALGQCRGEVGLGGLVGGISVVETRLGVDAALVEGAHAGQVGASALRLGAGGRCLGGQRAGLEVDPRVRHHGQQLALADMIVLGDQQACDRAADTGPRLAEVGGGHDGVHRLQIGDQDLADHQPFSGRRVRSGSRRDRLRPAGGGQEDGQGGA